jgi:hypothetical protein
VDNPFRKDPSQVPLAERNQIIQALSADRANRPLTNGVRLRGSHWRLQNSQAQSSDGCIELTGKFGVAVTKQEPVRVIGRDGFPELLQCQSAVGCSVTLQ